MSPRASIDSNLLVYAALEPGSLKGQRSAAVIENAAPRGVLAAQALLEFIAVMRRRQPTTLGQAIAQAEAWATVFEVAPTSRTVVAAAFQLVARHRLQVWDAVILSASAAVGADMLFSEDLQDGAMLGGVRVIDPFALADADFDALWR